MANAPTIIKSRRILDIADDLARSQGKAVF